MNRRLPSPKQIIEKNRLAEAAAASKKKETSTSEVQTESCFPSWIHILGQQIREQEKEEQKKLNSQNKKRLSSASTASRKLSVGNDQDEDEEEDGFGNSSSRRYAKDCLSETEYMKRLHAHEYKQLQQLREIVKQHVTSLGSTIYDVCAYKDVALAMKERFTVGPVSDLVLLSSKLFRRCSDLSRSLGTFFNICFADDFCDRDFDFTDVRLTKLSMRRMQKELDRVSEERDDLSQRCLDAEAKVEELSRSHEILSKQRDDAEARYSQVSQDMAALFEKSVEDVLQSEQNQLRNADMSLTAHTLAAPARAIAVQSVDGCIDKLSNVVASLKTLHDDVASVDFGGAMRTNIRNCDGLCSSVVSKLAHVRDGIRTQADSMTNEINNRRKAVELSVLHVLAAEKMRARMRIGREALDDVRQRAVTCSDFVRDARMKHMTRRLRAASASASGGGDGSSSSSLDQVHLKDETTGPSLYGMKDGGAGGESGDGDRLLVSGGGGGEEEQGGGGEPFENANDFSDHVAALIESITSASTTISHEEELHDIIDSLSCRVPQAAGAGKMNNLPLGRELLDNALEAELPDAAPFQQFAETAQFMREMYEERIRELEEKKGIDSSASSSSSSSGKHNNNNTTFASAAEAENAKSEAELLEEQAVSALETWRKKRRNETKSGVEHVANALRDLDHLRSEQQQQQVQRHMMMNQIGGGNNPLGQSDFDIAETPSLVLQSGDPDTIEML